MIAIDLWRRRHTPIASHGHRDRPILAASPWQNGFAERLIASIRRECLNHIIVLGEVHLRQLLQSCARYYNDIRTHRSLEKDAPITRQIQRIGSIRSHGIIGGLHTTTPDHKVFGRHKSRVTSRANPLAKLLRGVMAALA